jgi:hypothetical protein
MIWHRKIILKKRKEKKRKEWTNKQVNQPNQTLENLIEQNFKARKEERIVSYKTISKINSLFCKTIIEECKRKKIKN